MLLVAALSFALQIESVQKDNWGFELGNLTGWEKSGSAFDNQPTYGDSVSERRPTERVGHAGQYWIGTFENHPNGKALKGAVQGDAPQGSLTSESFTISERYIRFLVGGGSDPSTRVELLVQGSKAPLRTASGRDSEAMLPQEWDVLDLVGQSAQIRVVDASSAAWGHVNCDDFVFSSKPAPTNPPLLPSNPRLGMLGGKEIPSRLTAEQSLAFRHVNVPIAFQPLANSASPRAVFADGRSVGLIPVADLEASAKFAAAAALSPSQIVARAALKGILSGRRPATFDNIAYQTPVKSQGSRGTCCIFGPVGAMESVYMRRGFGTIDASEQHGNWIKNLNNMPDAPAHQRYALRNAGSWETVPASISAGVGCIGVTAVLSKYRVCAESVLPYIANVAYEDVANWPSYRRFGLETFDWSRPASARQQQVTAWSFDAEQMPPAVRENMQYGVKNYAVLTAAEFKSPEALEAIVASGRDVVFSMMLVSPTAANNPRDPVWRNMPGAMSAGGHCMSIVGYDRNRRFFIVKNSWGTPIRDPRMFDTQWADLMAARYTGYDFISYDYLTALTNEACVIDDVVIPVPSFTQRVLGLWDVTIRKISNGTVISSGVLAWRRLPTVTATGLLGTFGSTLRIGDYNDPSRGDFRVNALEPELRPTEDDVTFFIDFERPALSALEQSGVRIVCELQNLTTLSLVRPTLRGRMTAADGRRGMTIFGGNEVSELEFVGTLRL